MNIDCNVDISSLRCIRYLMHLPSNIETRQRGRKQRSTHKTFEQKPKCNSTLIRIKVTFQFPTNKSIIICRACVSFFVCVVFADIFFLSLWQLCDAITVLISCSFLNLIVGKFHYTPRQLLFDVVRFVKYSTCQIACHFWTWFPSFHTDASETVWHFMKTCRWIFFRNLVFFRNFQIKITVKPGLNLILSQKYTKIVNLLILH